LHALHERGFDFCELGGGADLDEFGTGFGFGCETM
jgi:hypothetical protein